MSGGGGGARESRGDHEEALAAESERQWRYYFDMT